MAKEFVPGYRPVLVRLDVKDDLLRFAASSGFLRESQVERCLASAAIDMVLSDAVLRGRLLIAYEAASVKNIQAIRAGVSRVASTPSSPALGTTAAAAAAISIND